MNQIERTFYLSQYMVGYDWWGSRNGAFVGKKLGAQIDTAGAALVRIALDNIKEIDVTFASAAIVDLVQQNLSKTSICLINLTEPDVLENVAAAAERMKVPVTVWNRDKVIVAGRAPSLGNRDALEYALARPEVRTTEFARKAGISIANASTKFKQLWQQGYLLRSDGLAASGGPEFLYSRIG